MKNLFVVSIVAMRDTPNGWTIDYDVVVPLMGSHERAKKSGMTNALDLWLEEAGWTNHGAHAVW